MVFWEDLGRFWEPKWSHVGTQIHKKIDANCEKRFFEKTRFFHGKKPLFSRFGGSKLEVKIDKKSIKKGVQHWKASWHRFFLILVVFGRQVGIENGAKIDPKRHRKNDEKKKGTKMAKKSQQVPATPQGPRGPGCRGGPPLQGGPNLWGRGSGPPGLAWPSGKAFKT